MKALPPAQLGSSCANLLFAACNEVTVIIVIISMVTIILLVTSEYIVKLLER